MEDTTQAISASRIQEEAMGKIEIEEERKAQAQSVSDAEQEKAVESGSEKDGDSKNSRGLPYRFVSEIF